MAHKVKIGLPYSMPGVTRERFGLMDMVVPYTIDDTNKFEVRLPLEDYTPQKGEQTVREVAQKQLAIYDHEFTL